MNTRRHTASIFLGGALALSGCERAPSDGPPSVHLGEDMCAQCGMIISDERFACAIVVRDERALPEPRLFDDFNCMINHETERPETPILSRWVHDHTSRDWLPAENAVYLCSPNLQTPMASHVAAFESRRGAAAAQKDLGGDTLDFNAIRAALALNGGCAGHPSPEAAP